MTNDDDVLAVATIGAAVMLETLLEWIEQEVGYELAYLEAETLGRKIVEKIEELKDACNRQTQAITLERTIN